MKNLSLVIVALLLAAPVFADEVQTNAESKTTLALSDNKASVNLQNIDIAELGAFLDKEVKAVSELLSAKIAQELPALANEEKAVNAKF